ncbi:CGNR zinc finger domain-containing protein [Pseudonocardia sp. CA-107938]|uniref:CGNR zinc finger domain-containing protein n=1 Tax=Pseudonocardia sp. CA-107938 TaxID=3240021 RepID=UPI003D916C53
MRAVPTWTWLEGHPALDLANTVKRTGMQEHDLLRSPRDLDSWLDAAALPAPRPETVDEADLAAVIALRDPALRLLRAAVGRGPWLAADVGAVNAVLLAAPEIELVGDAPGARTHQPLGEPAVLPRLLARLAAEVRDAAARPDLAFCDAPGCGQLFYRHRTNQAWCGPPCGNRARVARHGA